MAYDEELADRVRDRIALEPGVTEKRMFGGLAFLVDGNLAVAASGHGGLMVRVDPEDSEQLIASAPSVRRMKMGGRETIGWLRVQNEDVEDDAELDRWLLTGLDFARTLPPKE